MAVPGPTGAMLQSLKRLVWLTKSPFQWSTDLGQQVDTRADAPSTIRQLLSETISRMLWREWAAAPSAKQSGFRRSPLGYMTELIQEWTSISACENQAAVESRCRKKDWSVRKAGCLGSTAVGGQWTQERLYLAGFVDSPICFACQAGIGTVPHRTWCCKALHWDRVQGISSELVQEAREALEQEPHHPFWCQGLMPKEWMPTISNSKADHVVWYRGAANGTFEGTRVYTDGALRQYQWWKEANRAG